MNKQIPAKVVYENESVLAFRDVSPQAPVHIVIIPKEMKGLSRLINADESHKMILGEMLVAAAEIARQEKLEQGYRIVINDGKNGCKKSIKLGQSV